MIGAVICELISLIVIGFDVVFPYGLVLGLVVGIICTHLLAAAAAALAGVRKAIGVVLSYIVRVLLYAMALYLSARTGMAAFAGCAVGLLLPKAALIFGQLAMPKIRKAIGKEEAETEHFVAVGNSRARLLVKSSAMMKYQRGRAYLTYRHFKQYKLIDGPADEFAESAKSM